MSKRGVIAVLVACTIASVAPALADPGVPPHWSIPADAGHQAFTFGDCAHQTYPAGQGWVCVEQDSTER
jgi:hypothetical protein